MKSTGSQYLFIKLLILNDFFIKKKLKNVFKN